MNAVHYKGLLILNNMHVQREGRSEVDEFDVYFGSRKRMEQEFIMITKEKWLGPYKSRPYKHKKTMVSGGSGVDTWK